MEYEEQQRNYEANFDAIGYKDCLLECMELHEFYLCTLHRLFSKGSIKGNSLLDFGCGPTIDIAALCSRWIKNITQCEFLPQNRKQIEKWTKKDPDAVDWSFVLEPIARLEGYTDLQEGIDAISDRTRSSLKRILPCNAYNDPMVPDLGDTKFDVVVTSLCLESAALDNATYCDMVSKLGQLVSKDGLLVMCGVTGAGIYEVSSVTFKCLMLTESVIRKALADAGFKIITYDKEAGELDHPETPYESMFVVLAEKIDEV